VTIDNIIQAILSENSELTKAQILEILAIEKSKTGGLISDETLLRVVAAKRGVKLPHAKIYNCRLSISQLIPIMHDVTVVGRIVAIYPVKSYEGKKPGKYASLLIADEECILRVMLWNDKTSIVESGELKIGQIARFSHAYTREDRYGKPELHLGAKSLIEVDPQNVNETDFPLINHFLKNCGDITYAQADVYLAGRVKEVYPSSTFIRQDQTSGKALRFVLADDSGQVSVVAWNGKAEELEPILKQGVELYLVNAKAKSGSDGNVEVHVDATTFVDFSTSREQ
jgi:ssDNA-binding replication factor A large subunit